jgi:hypothetical protein
MDAWKKAPPELERANLLTATHPAAAPAQGHLTLSATP